MTIRVTVCLLVFWAMQAVAQMFFKWGSMSEPRWLWGFLMGNAFGFSSIWLLMIVYKDMNPNVAFGLATGGAFLLSQIALAVAFRSPVAPLQWTGAASIVLGILLLAMGAPRQEPTPAQPIPAGDVLKAAPDE